MARTKNMILTEGHLRRIGFNDPNVIRGILNDPGQVARYERELGLVSAPVKSAEQIAKEHADAVIASQQKIIDEEKAFLKTSFEDNPFSFDEHLATESAKQEYLPYYTELLEDYLGRVGVARETTQSESGLLKALKTTSAGTQGEENRAFTRAVAEAERGFAGSGLFFSGIKSRNIGAAEAERNVEVGQKATEVNQYNRDIFGKGRQYETALAGGVEKRRGEQLKAYYEPRVQSYLRKYPGGDNLLEGYLPSDFLRY